MCSRRRLGLTKKLNTKDLVQKIEKLTRAKIAAQNVVPLAPFREAQKEQSPRAILVIEDDLSMRSALQRILESEGYQVKMAADAMELSKVLDDRAIDMILMDLNLPWVNGLELAQLMKDHPDLKNIPLVFVSATENQEDMRKAFALGANDFIRKPFDVEHLKKTIRILLKANP